MISLALLSLVLAVGFSFYFFVNKSSTIANEQSELQFNVRLAKERVESIVRFASNMEIYENESGVVAACAPGDEAIYTDTATGSVIHYKGENYITLLEGNSDVNYEITFNAKDKFFLWYNVKGEMNGQSYPISSEIQILNIDPEEEIIKNFGDPSATGKAIVFNFE